MPPRSLLPADSDLALMTDLYELTMAAGYLTHGMHERRAVFELFVRALPNDRSYLLVAGLEQLIHHVRSMRFTDESIDLLRRLPVFGCVPHAFFDYLRAFRFRGDIRAVPEGAVV
ncbi:MAG: nicotinate phosphoribosyltransferase, partial [Phycisphaerae bacterium]